MFKPKAIYFEKDILNYQLGKELFEKYEDVPKIEKDKMTGRGRGKYWYKQNIREEGKKFFLENMKKYFPNNKILYIV